MAAGVNITAGSDITAGDRIFASNGTSGVPSVLFSSNVNTGFSAPLSNTLVAITNGVPRLTIGSTGGATFSGAIDTATTITAGTTVVAGMELWQQQATLQRLRVMCLSLMAM